VDGTTISTASAAESFASQVLMFGVLGDGCGHDASTWDYVAYEVHPPLPSSRPRNEWHPGTSRDQLVDALKPALPRAANAVGAVTGDQVACIAIVALDGAIRDVLPIEYDELHAQDASSAFRSLGPLVGRAARQDAEHMLEGWTIPPAQPICDPAPGNPCGPHHPAQPRAPVPQLASVMRNALELARRWQEHPQLAVRATGLAARAYADAVSRKLPGATAAVDRLVKRLSKLGTAGLECGL
jgi:hypothetical protein